MTTVPVEPGYTINDRVTRLEVNQANLLRAQSELTNAQAALARAVNSRPSWAVAMVITVLVAANAALATILAAVLAHP